MESVERRTEIWLSVIICITYVMCGQIVDNFYPFSSFAMYARVVPSASRIVARNSAGVVTETAEYTNWQCSTFTPADCLGPGDTNVVYRDREALQVVRKSRLLPPAPRHPPEAVLLVRRVWHFTPDVERHDCVIAHCTAERR